MKRSIWTVLFMGALGFGKLALAEETSATFTVDKMTCVTCPLTVRIAMEGVDGVIKATVDLESETATVVFDDSHTTVEEIAKASTNVGFPARPNGA